MLGLSLAYITVVVAVLLVIAAAGAHHNGPAERHP